MSWGFAANLAAGLAATAVLAVGGCAGGPVPATNDVTPFLPCPPAATGSSGPDVSPGVSGLRASGDRQLSVPALPCFVGGQPVELASLGRPAVVNLWASWCQPCRVELPELQRFADVNAGRVLVLGVVTHDTRSAAAAAATDLGVSFPALFDQDQAVLLALGRNALPVTLFLDAQGAVRFVYQSGDPLTRATLERLVADHLGLEVS